MFACRWPCLPLPGRGRQDASEAAEAAPVPVEVPAPALALTVHQQSAIRTCPTCGDPLASTDRRRIYCSDACKRQRNGHDRAEVPDLKPAASQPKAQDYTADWLQPPALPWES